MYFDVTTKKVIAKSTENLELSELQLKMISEASFGNLFLMFWYTRFELEHWLKIEDAMTKMLRCYVRGQDPNKLRFVFKRHGQPNELVSTPEEMALIYGMPRIPNREYLDYRLTQVNKKSGWRETEFFKRTFPTDMKAGDKVTRPMIVKAILKILKRTPINLKKKRSLMKSLCKAWVTNQMKILKKTRKTRKMLKILLGLSACICALHYFSLQVMQTL